MYVPVRVNPEQPVTGAVLGVLKVEQGARSLTLYGLSDESRSLRGTDGVPLLIRQLFAAGAAITVDDFGAGHSNLTRILDLPEAEAVKLDRYVMRTCLTRDPKLGGGLSAGLLLRHAHGCRRAVPVSASRSALSVHLPLFCPAFCVAKRGKIL